MIYKLYLSKILTALFLIFSGLRAQPLLDSLQPELEGLSGMEKVDYLSELGWSMRESNTDGSLILIRKAIELADSLNLRKEFGTANSYAGAIYLNYKYNTKKAVPYFQTAYETSLQLKDSIQIGYSYNNLGDAYYLTGNAPLAIEYARKSMEYFRALDDSLGIAYSHINFGLVYRFEKKLDLALEHFLHALEIRKTFDDKRGVGSVLYEIGLVYFEKEKYGTALEYFEDAYRRNEEIDNKKWMALSLDGIGDVYYIHNKYQEALAKYEASLKLNEARNHFFGIINNKIGKAKVYSLIGRKESGERELREALKLSYKLGIPINILDVYEAYAEFYLNLKDYDAAKKGFEEFMSVYDSLYSEQQFATLSELQNKFLINQSLSETEKNLEIQQKEEIYLFVFILLMSVMFGIVFWRYKLKKKLNMQLAESNESKDKLFSIIAHDLKNPFFNLMGHIGLLKDEELTEEEREECIKELDRTTSNTYALLENLLNLSASRTGKIEYSPERFNLKNLFENILSTLDLQLKKKSINVEFHLEAEKIYADKYMMEIVLRNLIVNAVKYSNFYGKIIIKSNRTNGKYFIAIKDNGIGMKHGLKEQLFKSEFIRSNHGTAGEKGTGLGLSLCKEFIEKHYGKINVESEEGIGTEFTIKIPDEKKDNVTT